VAAIIFTEMKARVRNSISVAICMLLSVLASTAYPAHAIALETGAASSEFDKCAAIVSTQARLSCMRNLIHSRASPSQLPQAGGWRLVTRQHANDAGSGTSIMRISDSGRSDENLIGVILRCKERGSAEMHLAVVTPYSPRANISVSFQIGAKLSNFPARIGASGSTLVLPQEAVGVLTGHAPHGADLKVEVVSGAEKTVGIIPLNGLDTAYAEMMNACKVTR